MNAEQKKRRDELIKILTNNVTTKGFWKSLGSELEIKFKHAINYLVNASYDAGYADAKAEIDELKRKYAWLIRHSWMCAAISKAKASELLGCSLIDFDEKIAQALKEIE